MLVLDQVSMQTSDMDGTLDRFRQMGHLQWVEDVVQTVHLFKHPKIEATLGDRFKVRLAYNYEFMPGLEFELTQVLEGATVQHVLAANHRMMHFGYRTRPYDQTDTGVDALLDEVLVLQQMGLHVLQVSQTVSHRNTHKRYRYAILDGGFTGGVPIRVGQRLMSTKHDVASIEAGKKLFACLQ